MKNGYFSALILLITAAFFIILPDILFSFINKNFKLSHDIKGLLLILPLSAGLVLNRFKLISIICVTLLCSVQLMQFSCLAYFGNCLSPYTVYLFFQELQDTFQEVGHVFFKYCYVIPIVILPFIGVLYCIKRNTKKSILGTITLLITFCYFGYKYYDTDRPRFNPNGIRFTIDNSLKAFWGYLILEYKNYPVKEYAPYRVENINNEFDEPINIIYIIGESTNYRHMSLFGYERNTTPQLIELSKQENVYYTKGISGAISTVSSCKFIMNSLREADNPIQAASDVTNLFKLAKEKGFKTFYLSTQTEHLIASISGANYIDVIKTKDSDPIKSAEISDDLLFDRIKKQAFSNRNFIVLHQRCVHTPYLVSISKNFKANEFNGNKDPVVDEYDAAMQYNDSVIAGLFNYFNKQTKGKFYIIWAPDHNELLGEKGLFGHGSGTLVPVTADIPIIIQTNDNIFLNKFKHIFTPNTYEITKCISEILGYKIINPNEDGETFYISGVDFNGKCGYIRYKKDFQKKEIIYLSEKEFKRYNY